MPGRLGPFPLLLAVVTTLPCDGRSVSQQEMQRRVDYADKHFSTSTTRGSQTDRGEVYIVLGPPDKIQDFEAPPNSDAYPAAQDWTYKSIPGIGTNVCIVFYYDYHLDSKTYRLGPGPCYSDFLPTVADAEAKQHYALIRKRIREVLGSGKGPTERGPTKGGDVPGPANRK